jgi:O-antigen/teichoic acid export membrane protein
LLLSFLVGQGLIQVLNLVAGFFLLRWMSVEAYAQYSVAFSFQSTLGVLLDLGFSGSIVALVGDRGSDAGVVGRYVRSARHVRNRLFLVLVPSAAVIFPFFLAEHKWPLTTQALLFVSIMVALYFQGWVSCYSPALLIRQRVNLYYRPQVAGAAGRALACLILHLASALTSWAAAWVNSAAVCVNGLLYRKEAGRLIDEAGPADSRTNREMLRYLAPLVPGTVFAAFQGQISVLLITWFGQTRAVAEVAALGRLGQLFLTLSAFNSVIVAPYIAKVPRRSLVRRYLQIVGGATAISVCICLVAFLYPAPFLWVLGPHYQALRREVTWTVAASCINYVGGVMWAMHSSLRWVYWWGTIAYISLLLITQTVCVSVMDLSTALNVIYFNLITGSAVTLIHVAGGAYGFRHGPRTAA